MTKEQNMFKYTPQAEPKIASHWSVLVDRKNWFWPVFRMEGPSEDRAYIFPATTPNSRALAGSRRTLRTERLWSTGRARPESVLRTPAFYLRTDWSGRTNVKWKILKLLRKEYIICK